MTNLAKLFLACLAIMLAATIVQAGTIVTDADAFVHLGSTGNNGTSNTIVLKRSTSGATSSFNRSGWVHFDLTGQPPASVATLTFTFHADSNIAGSGTVTVWGVIDGRPGDALGVDWSETEITRDNALYALDFQEGQDLTQVGSFSWSSAPTEGDTFTVSSPELVDFINADTNGEITLLLSRNPNDGNFSLKARESGSPTTLTIEYIPRAWQPAPADTQEDVVVDSPLQLTWKTGLDENNLSQPDPAITHHLLYVLDPIFDDSDPNFANPALVPIQIPVSGDTGTYSLAGIQRDATYFWRVDQKLNDNSVVTGLVWQFKTALSVPTITANPVADTLVDAGQAVQLSVEALNPFTGDGTGITYSWYQNGNLAQASASNTYAIAAADVSDEGGYYCIVKIDSNGATATSATGWVNVKRLVQHHTFNATLNDSAGTNHGSAIQRVTYPQGDPNYFPTTPVYAAGWDGSPNSALQLDGTYFVNIGQMGYPRSNSVLEHGTVECWIKTEATNDITIMGVYNNQPIFYSTGFQFHIRNNQIRGYLRAIDATAIERNIGTVNDGQWRYVTLTWQASANGANMAIYVDGQLQGTAATSGVYQEFGDWQFDMLIGASNGRGVPGGLFDGLIDDLKVYNYSIDREEVASRYYDYTGVKTCLFPPILDRTGPDGTPDCVVDLYDFASFVSSWLESGLRPE